MKKTKRFKLGKLMRNIGLGVLALVVLGIAFHHILNAYEQVKFPPIGQMIEVDGGKMHVFEKGTGDNTIVLLSGLGTSAPALDFEPLINDLSKENKVVVVEGFGYGWSDSTNKERTVKRIVEELRTALKKSGIVGPYVLMPHSMSGIYSLYYANQYPDEVKAIVGNDLTLPQAAAYFGEEIPDTPPYLSYLAPAGIGRLMTVMAPEDFLPKAPEGVYSKKTLAAIKSFAARKTYNVNVVDEANYIKQNIAATEALRLPENMPMLIFMKKDDRVREDGKSIASFYQTQLTTHPANKLIALEGHHYLHWTLSKEMSGQIKDFLASIAAH